MSIFNDESTATFDAMCISEPYIFAHPRTGEPTVNQQSGWMAITPKTHNQEASSVRFSFRAAIWVSDRMKHQEVETTSPDVAAVTLQTEGALLLLISIYVPYKRPREEIDLQERIACAQDVIQKIREKTDNALHVYVGGDFNRHSNVWGGKEVAPDRRKDDWPILQFMVEEELDSMLPRGTITFSHNNGLHPTTIDLVLVSPALQAAMVQCKTSDTDHGGDHRVIEARFRMPWETRPTRRLRRNYDKADWGDICKAVSLLSRPLQIPTKERLNEEAERFVKAISQIVADKIPYAKPHPNAKRWWTPSLTALRRTLSSLRNQETERRRRGLNCRDLHQQIQAVRKDYLSQMASQKAAHWKEFVDSPENVWKANSYTHMDPGSRGVPTLQGTQGPVDDDEGKATALLQAFFPPQPEPEGESPEDTRTPSFTTTHVEITEKQVRAAVFRSAPKKAPGPDDIPFLIWQKVWEEAKDSIMALYRASLRLRHLPDSWRTARIVPLRKPGKADYTVPKAFRPISLLATISKGLEAVVANRLAYLAERHNLLPDNHFGARKKRSCEQAINVLVERIYEAWRNRKVVSLVTFDVQGAFNGVNSRVLRARLEQRGIPETLSSWVGDFCRERTATVALEAFESERQPIAQAGIPQGSPLSPILYIFYNANLIGQPVDKTKGALGFVDDYSPWVVGDNVDENIQTLQTTIITKTERWARESGATFEPSKTGLIHFTRRIEEGQQDGPDLQFQGQDIKPSEHIKLLGVTLDSKMKFHQHVARVTAKAMKQCLAIKRLRGIRPKQVRQLYNATVTPIMDYCASAWYGPEKWGTTSLLRDMEKVQRIGAQAIILSFRATALAVAQAEASIETTVDRLQRKVSNHLLRSLTVPNTNPLFDCLTRLFTQGKSFPSPLAITARKFGPDLGLTAESLMETVEPVLQEPWAEGVLGCLVKGLEEGADVVMRQLRSKAGREERRTFYTDAAQKGGESGIAVVQGNTGKIITRKRLPRWAAGDSTVAELIAIEAALAHQAKKRPRPPNTIIATDSKQAIRQILEGTSPHGQYVVRYIRKHIDSLQVQEGATVTLQWVPAHMGWYGNEWADKQAKKALEGEQGEAEGTATQLSSSTNPLTSSDTGTPSDLLTPTDPRALLDARDRSMVKSRIYQQRYTGVTKKMALRVAKKTLQKKLDEIWKQARNTRHRDTLHTGSYTWKLDGALPGSHITTVYNALSAEEASILAQCRTGHSRLKSDLYRMKLVDSAGCECGATRETIKHVIYECPLLREDRQIAIEAVGHRWRDLSYILGGWNPWEDPRTGRPVDGPKEKWKANLPVVKAVLHFLHKSGRFAWQTRAVE